MEPRDSRPSLNEAAIEKLAEKSQERSQEAYCSSQNGKWVTSASRLQDGVMQDAEVRPQSRCFAVQAQDLQRNVL